jgi:hypothetical protein
MSSRGAVSEELEDGVVVQAIVVVLVLVVGQDAKDADADHLQEAVPHEVGIAGIVEGVGEDPSESDALVE